MPDRKFELAFAFIQSHPDVAANILEQQPIEEIAQFLAEVPHVIVTRVIEKMLPQFTARLCNYMQPTHISAFLAHMDFSLVSAILRHTKLNLRQQLIDQLPERTKLACILLLNYSEDTVGAWMATQVSTLPVDCTVSQGIETLKQDEYQVNSDVIYVVNRDRFLQGQVAYSRILKAQGDSPLSSIISRNTHSISGRTHLDAAIHHELWSERDSIPVVNRHNQFVGILRHVDLRNGINQIANAIETPPGSDPITSILSVYGNSLFSLLNTVGDLATNKSR